MKTTLIALAIIATLMVAAAGFASHREVASSTATATAEPRSVPASRMGLAAWGSSDRRARTCVAGWSSGLLVPGSRHAVHFHGPNSSCGQKADPVAATPTSSPTRAASPTRRSRSSRVQVLRKGIYYNVHARPLTATDNPEIACANVVPIG